MVLTTANHKITLNNAPKGLKDKHVLYSPSITYGVDFTIATSQDVFIYISGESILPSGCFQQTTRTENIKNLYFYNFVKPNEAEYNSLDKLYNK